MGCSGSWPKLHFAEIRSSSKAMHLPGKPMESLQLNSSLRGRIASPQYAFSAATRLLTHLLDGSKVCDKLPALRLGESGPGWHAAAEVPLPEKPLEVAVCYCLNSVAAERRLLFAVSHRVRLVALLAMLAIDESARRDRIRMGVEWIDAGVVLCGDPVPVGRSRCAEKNCAHAQTEEAHDPSIHFTPPLRRNQVPTCGSSDDQPMR